MPKFYSRLSFLLSNYRSCLAGSGRKTSEAGLYVSIPLDRKNSNPHFLSIDITNKRRVVPTGPVYFVFCRLYPFSLQPPRQCLGPACHLSTLNFKLTLCRRCGPLSIQSSLGRFVPPQRPNSGTKSSLLFTVTWTALLEIFISSNSRNLLQFL